MPLAELFSSMGMEGEASWQAAAQVRLLLTPQRFCPEAIHGEALGPTPDVRWLPAPTSLPRIPTSKATV